MKVNIYDLILDSDSNIPTLKVKNQVDCENEFFRTPNAISDFMNKEFAISNFADEYVFLLAFNSAMKIVGIFEVSHGNAFSSFIDGRGIFIRSMLVGATGIILVHNHPSKGLKPSTEDMCVCERIKEIGDLINILLKDFIIIGDNNSFSFAENKIL